MELMLTEKRTLLRVARDSIECALKKEKTPMKPVLTDSLRIQAGAFVTLEINDRLRGCVGFIQSQGPLFETVRDAAISAALHDNRFEPLTAAELDHVRIEISVLTPMEKIELVEEIETGKHGLMIEQGHRHGLLLPQVATDYGWDRMTFLEQTCVKAGLSKEAWKNPETTIYRFSALVFGEKDVEAA